MIAGAGAVGLAFADTLLASSDASVLIVDRRAQPGGHWNDAYPFVRLHGPSVTYGVESMPLGSERLDGIGLNRGLHELAGGAELCAYYDRLLRERLLPSGRVQWLPLHDVGRDGIARSLLDGRRVQLRARRRWVDATLADTQVPSTHAPPFAVAPGVRLVTPAGLARPDAAADGWVIVGGGKTAIDSVLWLLEQGVDPDAITWVRPRDSWLLNRVRVQPTRAFAGPLLAGMVAEFEAVAAAQTPRELFLRLEAAGQLLRIDPEFEPTMYRCAIVSEAELQQLRRVRRVVRAGHVCGIERGRIVLQRATVATSPGWVHVHCASNGLPRGPAQPVFQGARIVPQYVRRCSPTFSAALVAHIEATVAGDDDARNALCAPIPAPREPMDWLRMHLATARNQREWSRHPALLAWLRGSRLEAYTALFEHVERSGDAAGMQARRRLAELRPQALRRMADWLQPEPADAVA